MLKLIRIEAAPPGDTGVRVLVEHQDGSTEVWKAFAVEVVLDDGVVGPNGPTTPEIG